MLFRAAADVGRMLRLRGWEVGALGFLLLGGDWRGSEVWDSCSWAVRVAEGSGVWLVFGWAAMRDDAEVPARFRCWNARECVVFPLASCVLVSCSFVCFVAFVVVKQPQKKK